MCLIYYYKIRSLLWVKFFPFPPFFYQLQETISRSKVNIVYFRFIIFRRVFFKPLETLQCKSINKNFPTAGSGVHLFLLKKYSWWKIWYKLKCENLSFNNYCIPKRWSMMSIKDSIWQSRNKVDFCCVRCNIKRLYIFTVYLSKNILNFITFLISLSHRVMRNIGFKVPEIKHIPGFFFII